jgi:hypothetical protein
VAEFENTLITTTPAVIKAIPKSAGRSSTCFVQTQATAVTRTILKPDQRAYTIPVGIILSGKESSQNAAAKHKIDMKLASGFEKLSDAASAMVAITSVRIDPAKQK